jgi:hypothetical protein
MRKKFKRFLKEHGIDDFDDREKGIGFIYDKWDPYSYFNIDFDDQPEGFDFWMNLEKEWHSELSK